MNDYQKTRFAKNILSAMFNTITGKRIAIFGFAFKKVGLARFHSTGPRLRRRSCGPGGPGTSRCCCWEQDTGDTRETAAAYVIRALLEERAAVVVYDPKVKEEQMRVELESAGVDLRPGREGQGDLISMASTPEEAAAGAHAIAIMTEWDEFKSYDYGPLYASMKKPVRLRPGSRPPSPLRARPGLTARARARPSSSTVATSCSTTPSAPSALKCTPSVRPTSSRRSSRRPSRCAARSLLRVLGHKVQVPGAGGGAGR